MRRAVILFDNDCGFCRWSLSKLLAWDRHGRLQPIALQSEQADDFLVGMDRERKMASWHLVAPNGRIYSGGEAVPQLARLITTPDAPSECYLVIFQVGPLESLLDRT